MEKLEEGKQEPRQEEEVNGDVEVIDDNDAPPNQPENPYYHPEKLLTILSSGKGIKVNLYIC